MGISLEELHERLRNGSLPSKNDSGFLFVDVAPDSPVMMRISEPPPTYVDVTAEELQALTEEDEDEPIVVPITSSPDWAGARQNASQLRRRPAA